MALPGLDIPGFAHPDFKLRHLHEWMPDGYALGFFDDTFLKKPESAIRKADEFLTNPKFDYSPIRVQLHWDYGHRPVPMDKLRQKAPKWEEFAKSHRTNKIFLSFSCEVSNIDRKGIMDRVTVLQRMCPSCIPVYNPMRGSPVPNVKFEIHNIYDKLMNFIVVPSTGIISSDGQNVYDGDMETWKQKNAQADIIFFWGARFNGLEEAERRADGTPAPRINPLNRTAWPTRDDVRAIIRLTQPMGTPPVATMPATPLRAPNIWKTHAEDMFGDQGRDNKPCYITKHLDKGGARILTHTGKEIGKLAYFGTYGTDQHRYYSGWRDGIGEYGYKIGYMAKTVSGSEFIWLETAGKIIGPIHPAFRKGTFHA